MTIRSAYAYKDALKKYKPQQVKVLKWTHASSPASFHLKKSFTSVDVDRAMALFASALARAADMAHRGGTTRDWKRGSI